MIFNVASVVDWKVITSEKQQQVDIDNVWENARRVTHDYAIVDQVYVKMTDIYRKLDYSKQVPYIIIEVFTNDTVWVQLVQVNEHIDIRQLNPHFVE